MDDYPRHKLLSNTLSVTLNEYYERKREADETLNNLKIIVADALNIPSDTVTITPRGILINLHKVSDASKPAWD
jgi:hypothetical protein